VKIIDCREFLSDVWDWAAIEWLYGENGFIGWLLWTRAFKFELNASFIDLVEGMIDWEFVESNNDNVDGTSSSSGTEIK